MTAAQVACFAGLPFLYGRTALPLQSMSAYLFVEVVVMSTFGVMTARSIERILGQQIDAGRRPKSGELEVAES